MHIQGGPSPIYFYCLLGVNKQEVLEVFLVQKHDSLSLLGGFNFVVITGFPITTSISVFANHETKEQTLLRLQTYRSLPRLFQQELSVSEDFRCPGNSRCQKTAGTLMSEKFM